MNFLTIFIIGLGLMFDTFAVSVSGGISKPKIKFLEALKVATIFVLAQGLLPFVGWLIGKQIAQYIQNLDHWISFILLAFIGGKMIFESFKNQDDTKPFDFDKIFTLIILGIATSIDALIIGFSFALIDYNIYISAITFGIQTGFTAMIGMLLGKKVGNRLGRRAEIIGGLILIGIGIKILIEHLT